MLGFSSSGGSAGLTDDGAQAVVSQHCTFGARDTKAQTNSRLSVQDMLRALVEREEAMTDRELRSYHRGLNYPEPDHGRYGHRQDGLWFDEVGREQLGRLPGVSRDGETWEFVGVDPDEFDEEHTLPLDDLRDDPRARAKRELDDLDVEPGTDRREALLKLHAYLADLGDATSEELDGDVRRVDLGDHADDLARLPSVNRIVNQPPEPEDIQIETYADVLEAERTVSQDPVTEWRYTPDEE